jgi:hypothetical protein
LDIAHIHKFAIVLTLHCLSYRPSNLITLLSDRDAIPVESMLTYVKEVKRIADVHDC